MSGFVEVVRLPNDVVLSNKGRPSLCCHQDEPQQFGTRCTKEVRVLVRLSCRLLPLKVEISSLFYPFSEPPLCVSEKYTDED